MTYSLLYEISILDGLKLDPILSTICEMLSRRVVIAF